MKHPNWLVVVEHPGGSGRTFGITVAHRDRAAPDADWSCTDEELEAGDIRVAGGSDWRTLCMALLHDLAGSTDIKPRIATFSSWCFAQHKGRRPAPDGGGR
jgi:hypothetical protein